MKLLFRSLLILAVLALVVAGVGLLMLRSSLPQLEGELPVAGLRDRVTIERDALGVVTISASTRVDAAFATGVVHAQERFFQMDLQRRRAAGELAELFGAALLASDRRNRVHRFRTRARLMIESAGPDLRAVFGAYTAGVNAGLGAMHARPFEYFLLRAAPREWRDEDILLIVFSMYLELNDEYNTREAALALLHDRLPAPVYEWLLQDGTAWDAPLVGPEAAPRPLPGPDVVDLRHTSQAASRARVTLRVDAMAGSNNWAVAGEHTAHGGGLLAGDMHLRLSVPNIWFRSRIRVLRPGSSTPALDVTGVTLPGTPLIVAGSNGHIAWSLTNSYGDWVDLVLLELDPDDATRYRAPDGFRRFDEYTESIRVRDGATENLLVRESIWGPVIDPDHRGRARSLAWIAHRPGATNDRLMALERVRDVEAALAVASRIGAPPQNFVVADAAGNIGWTVMGRIPRRVGIEPLLPQSWADGSGWDGWYEPEEYPRIVNPPGGRIWTANNRTVTGPWLDQIGRGEYALGARAGQIRAGLLARESMTPRDALEIQLDDRALFLSRWHELLLATLTPQSLAADPRRTQLRDILAQWQGRASIDDAAYPLVREFRTEVHLRCLQALLAGTTEESAVTVPTNQLERPVWELVTSRPAHLLDPGYPDWDAFLLAAADAIIARHWVQPEGFIAPPWGQRNLTRIAHPIALAVPALGRWLDMPARPLPGDVNMPRVQSPIFGASQRMAVSPGREGEGYFHMPGGQSGHPLSPFYGAGHDDWAAGRPTPFLPGATRHTLILFPEQ